ncbi:MAG: carnitine dehydratase, partial [Acidimicrobiia bacterium]
MTGVLHGLVVIDCSWGVAGPVATMILADNGARVTRIEPPRGDPFARGAGVWHRGKRRAVIDLGDPEGAEAFRRLALAADVVVETFSPGTMERLGLSYEALAPDNPGLVWCS